MTYEVERMIEDIKDNISWTRLAYSGGQSVDRSYCPLCGADDVIKYQSNQKITMDTLEHTESCAYTLIRKLEKELENQETEK